MKPEPSISNSATANPTVSSIRAYHQRTKHKFTAYAQGPETLDWEAQPAPFRHYENIPNIQLPNFTESLQDPDLLALLTRPFSSLRNPIAPLPLTLTTLGALLHLALGITAWKSYGPDRWALRSNPSSGNLHPIEAYVIVRGLFDLSDGVYHYCSDSHSLERRASIAYEPNTMPMLQIGLSSAMWREAWKYGERAFRYCQLDTGHAVGSLCYAAQTLGYTLNENTNITTVNLAHLLGVDRDNDFPVHRHPETEREEAEILLNVSFNNETTSISHSITPDFWQGKATTLDPHPIYHWPVIEEVALASRQNDVGSNKTKVFPVSNINLANENNSISIAKVILGRRSAQRFDSGYVLPAHDFIEMLEALLPVNSSPWNTLSSKPSINLLLFVHRIEGFKSGIYLLTREPRLSTKLDSNLSQQFLRERVANLPTHLNLQFLKAVETIEFQRVVRSLHCHQDIAANACFALGMLAEYDDVIINNPAAYRDLHREAGLIGQVLYLQAEMIGLRGTGIGCFFDDPIHDLLGLTNESFQCIYHFTVGLALDDTRIESISTSNLTFM